MTTIPVLAARVAADPAVFGEIAKPLGCRIPPAVVEVQQPGSPAGARRPAVRPCVGSASGGTGVRQDDTQSKP